MKGFDHLVEQHIREYDSHQKHIEELFKNAQQKATDKPEFQDKLGTLADKHGALVNDVEDMKEGKVDKNAVKAIEEAGPMGIWFGLVSEIETLVEHMEE